MLKFILLFSAIILNLNADQNLTVSSEIKLWANILDNDKTSSKTFSYDHSTDLKRSDDLLKIDINYFLKRENLKKDDEYVKSSMTFEHMFNNSSGAYSKISYFYYPYNNIEYEYRVGAGYIYALNKHIKTRLGVQYKNIKSVDYDQIKSTMLKTGFITSYNLYNNFIITDTFDYDYSLDKRYDIENKFTSTYLITNNIGLEFSNKYYSKFVNYIERSHQNLSMLHLVVKF